MVSAMESYKFLILRLSAVGDVIRTLPAVKALKENFPFSHITWIVEEPCMSLLESQPGIDEVILFPRKRWTRGIKSVKGIQKTLKEMGSFIANLRKKKFDVVLDFHGILKSGFLSYLSGAPKRIGFDRQSSKEGNFLFSNVKVGLPGKSLSRYERNFSLLKGLGLEAKGSYHALHIPKEDQNYIESFFKEIPFTLKKPLIALHPGTSPKTAYKRWMPERYSLLADRLIREIGASVVFTWGPGELNWVEGIRKGMEETSILAPRTETLTQLGEIFRRCNLYVGGDTGPMHIASFVDTPVVAIYGPTDPVVNEPLGRHVKIRKDVGCNPCRNRECKELHCLEAVTVDDVFNGAKEILSIEG
jgi:lipopolysaccharide heptosyltransferase I